MSRPVSPRKFFIVSLAALVLSLAGVLIAVYLIADDLSLVLSCAMVLSPIVLISLGLVFKAALELRERHQDTAAAEEQTGLLLESLPASTIILDATRKILRVNRQAEKLFGYKRGELLGKQLGVLVPDRVEELFAASTVDSGLGGISALDPLRYREGKRKDGRRVPLEVRIRPLKWAGQDAFLGLLRDATELQETERSLRQAEAKYRSIFENAAEGIYQLTPEGRFLTANPALARMLGYDSPEELIAKVTDVKKQVFVEPSQRSVIRLLSEQTDRARGFEYQAYRKDGTKIWVMGNQRVVRSANNRVVYYEGNIEEITERKRAEDALRESQRALMTLMSNLPGMAYRCRNDRDRTMEFVSEGAFELTGRSPADFLQNRAVAFGELIDPGDRGRLWDEIQRALLEDRPFQVEYRIRTANGVRMVWEQGRGVRSFINESGLALEGLIIDVDQRARAQEGLRKSEEQFRQLAENVHGVFWMTNPDMTELFYVNRAYEKIWGQSRASLYRDPGSRLEVIDAQDRERVQAACRTAVTDGFDQEYRIVLPDGEERWIWDRAFPIADEQGQVYRLAGIAEEITERKRLEEQYRQAQKMEAIGRLAGGIAHDFNNLLCIMNGYSDLLQMGLEPGSENHEYSLRIGKAGERAANLTRQLLAFSRKTMLIPKILDLNALLTSIADMIRRLIGEDVVFALDLDPVLGQTEADPGQLEQVVMNLVVNSRDAMPTGGHLTIETRNATLSDDAAGEPEGLRAGDYIVMRVRDTGHGIDSAHHARIFEPFFTTKEVGKGTGLGLAMVYGVVKQSGGEIQVDSETGKGTCFTIYLPRMQEATNHEAAHEAASTAGDSPKGGPETVLLVEDEEMVREMARNLLIKCGYTVLEAADGQAALKVAESHDGVINLLITDVVMPTMNGPDLARRLTAERTDLKVLFMTGYTDSALRRYGMFDPGQTALLKPFSPGDFLRTVREVIDQPAARLAPK